MGSQPPPYDSAVAADDRMERFRALAARYEIREDFCRDLRQLDNFEIIVVCDDSGSMSRTLDDHGAAGPFAPKKTRWDELREAASVIVDIGTCLDANGVDVYFLNRAPCYNVRSSAQVAEAFRAGPNGFTPLTAAVQLVLQQKAHVLRENKPILLVIATDGAPTDREGNDDVRGFQQCIKALPKNVYVSFLACTDNDDEVAYLNKMDGKFERVDVSDDYRSERAQILKVQGQSFRFSFGDYIVKAMLGPSVAKFDQLDERRHGRCLIS
ncbi:VWFA domain-containing protein [Plasmodiophora brassicae]